MLFLQTITEMGYEMNSIYWIIILAVLILIEIIALNLTTIWFAGGALAAFIASLYFDNLLLEVIIFAAVSLALLFFTRPVIIQYFESQRAKTDDDDVIGKEALVTVTVDNMTTAGQVDVDGQRWSARSLDGTAIVKGSKVKVQGISGTKLIVSQDQPD